MGVVWRGRDRTTGAVYAIKVLLPEYASDPAAVGRFVRERTALLAFRHRNVVTVHDMIVEGDQLALVMDLVSGGDLDGLRKARGGRLAPAEAASLAVQIGEGLAAAHAAGIVHRDLKPANVLLNKDQVLLADFGIALLAGQSRVTTEGRVLGTAAYLAPEVISGQDPEPAGDVYALGITLYELLAGQPPFTGNTAAVLHAHVTAAPPGAPGIPDALWEIIGGCLAKDPASRPPATEVAASLRAFAASANPASASQWLPMGPDPLQAVRTTPHTKEWLPTATAPHRAAPAGRRRTMIIAALSVTAVVLLAVGAITLHPFQSGASAQQQAQAGGSGWAASQSASAAAARAHRGERSASPRPSVSKGTNGKQDSSPSPGDTRSTSSGKSSGSNGSGSTASPSPSSAPVTDADGLPVLHASADQMAHECVVIGSAYDSNTGGTVEGVVCADILTSSASGHYVAQGQLELICQTTAGADVQCADAIADGELSNEADGVVASTGAYQCGHSYGACSAGRNYVKTGSYSYSGISDSDCSSNTSSATDAWALAVGNGSTKIELPGSDDWVSLSSSNADDGANQSTGHHYICP
jgi:serine/threonine protein kinase